jgi:hypothetical protein
MHDIGDPEPSDLLIELRNKNVLRRTNPVLRRTIWRRCPVIGDLVKFIVLFICTTHGMLVDIDPSPMVPSNS